MSTRAVGGASTKLDPSLCRGQSAAADPRAGVAELHAALTRADPSLVVLFCSSDHDLDAVATEVASRFADVQVVGCTTAGEIGPAGCLDRSISGLSLPADSFTAVSGRLDGLEHFELSSARALVQDLLQKLEQAAPSADARNTFAFLLIDGLAGREEPVARSLQAALGAIPLVGGSAGDGVRFGKTHVFHDGAFRTDSAVVTLVSTDHLFQTFKAQHFVPSDLRMVVTAANDADRVVTEIDGRPAAEAYARVVGVEVDSLDPLRFAAQPVVVLIDGTNYVRSIQQANPDGSLTFFCAIEEGLVLRVARGVGLVESLERSFADLRAEVGPLDLVLGFDCILRKLEVQQDGLGESVAAILEANNVVGFNSYGEQHRGVHVNQTFTGVAIGRVRDA